MKSVEKRVAEQLLKIKAIKLQPKNPFTWASGIKSPIYCDNRLTLSYPKIRGFIKIELSRLVLEMYPDVDLIAGIATGAIAQGALVADELGLPFIYVRSAPKGHGLENLIEGDLRPGQKVVIIEDLISTGGSSLRAAEAIRNNGGEVLGLLGIFTYNLPQAEQKLKKANIKFSALCTYEAILSEALETKNISEEELEILKEWKKNPEGWQK